VSDQWRGRHLAAMRDPQAGHEAALVKMLTGWQYYAAAHRARYGSEVGDDGVLGPEWAAIGRALRGLLNGETGRLDCGTLDATILDTLSRAGCSEDES